MKRMSSIANELKRLASQAGRLKAETDAFIGNVTFNYEEQELINRVFKSVLPQFEDFGDKVTARSILDKTRWTDVD
jgi:hypothetical protein